MNILDCSYIVIEGGKWVNVFSFDDPFTDGRRWMVIVNSVYQPDEPCPPVYTDDDRLEAIDTALFFADNRPLYFGGNA